VLLCLVGLTSFVLVFNLTAWHLKYIQ
jgi:hypothetical protein